MTSATDALRALLDERGVEYETYTEPRTGFEHVKWNFNEHGSADFNLEFGEPWLVMYGVISGPEQAVAATLGPGTCEVEWRESGWGTRTRHCGACGADLDCDTRNKQNYCPNCGRKLVE